MCFTTTRFILSFAFLLWWTRVNGYSSRCSSNGFKCASCEELIHCVGLPPNAVSSYKVNLIHRCDNTKGDFCSTENGGCVKDASVCRIFGLQKLHCEDSGAFPDPYDCNSYHMCVKQEDGWISTKHRCPENRAFDPLTATCRFKPTHRVCREKPVETCLRPLQEGPLPEEPNIYYVCVRNNVDRTTLEPRLYKCKPNQVYSKHECIENVSAARDAAADVDVAFVCEKPGYFADTRNCYAFFECDDHLKSTHKTCLSGTYFHSKEAMCVKGDC